MSLSYLSESSYESLDCWGDYCDDWWEYLFSVGVVKKEGWVMIGWAPCFELNFCIILYDSMFFFSQKKGEGEGMRGYYKYIQFGMIYGIYFVEYCSLEDLFLLSEGNSLYTVSFEVMADHYSIHGLSLVGIV